MMDPHNFLNDGSIAGSSGCSRPEGIALVRLQTYIRQPHWLVHTCCLTMVLAGLFGEQAIKLDSYMS